MLGLDKNSTLYRHLGQFSLLVLVNTLIGGMVGLERSILPELAGREFGIAAQSAILSFIVAFGVSKAAANYFAGRLAGRIGKKRTLLMGWLVALPVPWLLIYATSWQVVVGANVLLGISQGFTWSSAVMMKIDLAGKKYRGLAMGINESSGYLAVGLMALVTGFVAGRYGLRPYPFYLGVVLSVLGFLLTWIRVRDTAALVAEEIRQDVHGGIKMRSVFWETSIGDNVLGSVTQAGLINNMNDGMIWGLLPALLLAQNYSLAQVGVVAAVYPSVWGVGQLLTGKWADQYSKKKMLAGGMLLQGLAILGIASGANYVQLIILSGLLGVGTALVYPTFFVAIADRVHPAQRAESIGTFRLWRDLGYALGALLSGWVADRYGVAAGMAAIGVLTILSSVVIAVRMPVDSVKVTV